MKKLKLFGPGFVFLVLLFAYSCDEKGFEFDGGDLSPIITLQSPSDITFTRDGDFEIKALLLDDTGLSSISLSSTSLNVDETITLAGETLYELSRTLSIATDFGTFELSIMTTDQAGNTAEVVITFTKEEVIGNFVYAVGGATWNSWDPSKAQLMVPDEDNPGWFEITLYSDGTQGNGEVKFIGQLDWAPNNWGPESNTEVSSSGISGNAVNSESSGTLILPEGYSEVRFNPDTRQFQVNPISEALPTPNGQFFIMGCGFQDESGNDIDLCWDTSKAYPMVQDDVNPYLHRVTVRFTDAVDLKFNGNRAWDNLDWGFPNGLGPEEKIAPDGDVQFTRTGSEWGADWKYIDRSGTYNLIVDEYLGTAQIRKLD